MAVDANVQITLWPNESVYDPAEPHGYWSGYVTGAGAAGGGNMTLSLDLDPAAVLGRFFTIRTMFFWADKATALIFQVLLDGGYWTGSAVRLRETTVAGGGGSGWTYEGHPYLLVPANNQTLEALVRTTAVNTDTEDQFLFCQGEYWERAVLRKTGVGPRIRW